MATGIMMLSRSSMKNFSGTGGVAGAAASWPSATAAANSEAAETNREARARESPLNLIPRLMRAPFPFRSPAASSSRIERGTLAGVPEKLKPFGPKLPDRRANRQTSALDHLHVGARNDRLGAIGEPHLENARLRLGLEQLEFGRQAGNGPEPAEVGLPDDADRTTDLEAAGESRLGDRGFLPLHRNDDLGSLDAGA